MQWGAEGTGSTKAGLVGWWERAGREREGGGADVGSGWVRGEGLQQPHLGL